MRPSLAAKTRLTLRVHIVCCEKGACARRDSPYSAVEILQG